MASGSTMRRVSLRNILAHKLRLALTILAVVLGTSFIAGSFMFTKTLSDTFDSAISSSFDGVDAAVSPADGQDGISEETRQAIAADPEVGSVNVRGSQTVVAANEDSEAFQTGGGSSSLVPFYPEDEYVGESYTMSEGNAPEGTDEVVINQGAVDEYGIAVGDTLILVTPDEHINVEVSGIYDPPVSSGSSITLMMDEAGYLERFVTNGVVTSLAVSGAGDSEPDALVEHLNNEYDVSAESGEKLAEEMTEAIAQGMQFINYFLVAFGLIALLVGTFIIANTFSMIVAQRTKEFALLRALGASRRQITNSVVTESFIVGVIGSAVGVLAGMGLVAIIKLVLNANEMPMGSGLGLTPSAVLVPMILGTIVTVISAWAPARRAGSVEPVEAMRTTESAAGSSLKVRTIIGTLMLLVGAAFAIWGAVWTDGSTGSRASLVGVGALLVVVGFFLAGPALSLPIVPAFGRLIGAPFGAVGSLAATNSKRNPRRTSATAFALTLGLALVTAIGMLGATMNNSIEDLMEDNVSADYILSGPTDGSFPTPGNTAEVAQEAEGVATTTTAGMAPVLIDGQSAMNYGPQFEFSNYVIGNPEELVTFEVVEGSMNLEENPGFIAVDTIAEENGWEVGESYELTSPVAPGETREVELIGTYKQNPMLEGFAVSKSIFEDFVPDNTGYLLYVGVNGEEGIDQEELRTNLEESLKELIVVQVMTSEEYGGEATAMITQMLSILYALLALAVIIAILGIVNTLTLGVIERRQEIGMLRAVGTQRRQVRTMITLEAVQIAVFGAVMGMLIGLGLGWAFIEVLSGTGLEGAVVPWGQLAIMLVSSAVVGVIAAIWPSARAAKTPPLEAIAD
ncbi:ABC transporter permease [Corynebacterium sp. L4756]|uniref:ABC transporter permease n=1 Tax=unclassified Corynebacterium TaxID=2624378 RepID=UPI00374D58DF